MRCLTPVELTGRSDEHFPKQHAFSQCPDVYPALWSNLETATLHSVTRRAFSSEMCSVLREPHSIISALLALGLRWSPGWCQGCHLFQHLTAQDLGFCGQIINF